MSPLVCLQVYPRLYGGSRTMYNSSWWQALVLLWEWLMFVFFGFPAAPVVWLVLGAALFWLRRQRARRRRVRKSAEAGERDLDV